MSVTISSQKLVKMGVSSSEDGYYFYDSVNKRTFIVMNTYDVNNQPVYEEWTDANYRVHRVMAREQRIAGSFQVKFYKRTDYEEFLDKFGKTEYSYTPVILTVYVNNLGETRQGYFYIEFTTKDEIPYMDGGKEDSIDGITIAITEA